MAPLWRSSERTTAKSWDRLAPSRSFEQVEGLFVMVPRTQNQFAQTTTILSLTGSSDRLRLEDQWPQTVYRPDVIEVAYRVAIRRSFALEAPRPIA
jgi:hypothetical protein